MTTPSHHIHVPVKARADWALLTLIIAQTVSLPLADAMTRLGSGDLAAWYEIDEWSALMSTSYTERRIARIIWKIQHNNI